jgi:hypothetical protein
MTDKNPRPDDERDGAAVPEDDEAARAQEGVQAAFDAGITDAG